VTDAGIAMIVTNSDTGFDSCIYSETMPPALKEAGMDDAKWRIFIREANVAVKYNWALVCCGYGFLGVCGMCSFLCNMHNKTVQGPMDAFCSKVNSGGELPLGITVRYMMLTETVMVPGQHGQGATLESFHKLIFESGELATTGQDASATEEQPRPQLMSPPGAAGKEPLAADAEEQAGNAQ